MGLVQATYSIGGHPVPAAGGAVGEPSRPRASSCAWARPAARLRRRLRGRALDPAARRPARRCRAWPSPRSSWRTTSTWSSWCPSERRGWALGIFGLSGLTSTALAPLVARVRCIRQLGFPLRSSPRRRCSPPARSRHPAHEGRCAPARARRGPGPRGAWPRWSAGAAARAHGAGFFFGLGTGTVFTFLPTFAEQLGVTGLGLFYTAYAGAAMAVRVVGRHAHRRPGRRAVIVPSMFVLTCATGILARAGDPGDAGARACRCCRSSSSPGSSPAAAHGFLYPALSALLVDVTPERRRGSAVGIFSAVVPGRQRDRRDRVRLRRARARLRAHVEDAGRAADRAASRGA